MWFAEGLCLSWRGLLWVPKELFRAVQGALLWVVCLIQATAAMLRILTRL
jgi:hypothetical protein